MSSQTMRTIFGLGASFAAVAWVAQQNGASNATQASVQRCFITRCQKRFGRRGRDCAWQIIVVQPESGIALPIHHLAEPYNGAA